MKTLKFIVLLLMLSMTACHQQESAFYRHVQTSLSDTMPVPVYSLVGDTLCYDALWPTDILTIDSFMLIAQHKDKNLIHVYRLNDTTRIGAFLQKGGGPEEVAMWNGFTQYWKEGGEIKLLIQSYPNYVAIMNLTQTLSQNKVVYEKRFPFQSDSANVIMARSNVVYKVDNRFLMSRAPERISGLKDYNACFQWFDYSSDKPGQVIYATDQPLHPVPFLYTPGGVCFHPAKRKICFSCRFLNMFSLLDVDTGNATQFVPENKVTDLDALVSEKKDATFLGDVAYTDKYLYLVNYGGISARKINKTNSKIEVYDWEGKHISTLSVPDPIYYITVDNADRTLYAVVHNGGMKKYQLPLQIQ